MSGPAGTPRPGAARPARTCEGDGAAGQAVVPVHPRDGVPDGEAQRAVLDALPAPRVLRDHLAEHVPAGQCGVSGGSGAGLAWTPQRHLPPASPVLEPHHGGGGGARHGRTARPANGRGASAVVANGRRAGAGTRGGKRGPASLHGPHVRSDNAGCQRVTESAPLGLEKDPGSLCPSCDPSPPCQPDHGRGFLKLLQGR